MGIGVDNDESVDHIRVGINRVIFKDGNQQMGMQRVYPTICEAMGFALCRRPTLVLLSMVAVLTRGNSLGVATVFHSVGSSVTVVREISHFMNDRRSPSVLMQASPHVPHFGNNIGSGRYVDKDIAASL